MSGAWVRLIRSVKISIDHVLQREVTTEEVFHTILVETEHSVNSRPLTHVSMDPRDEEALTPYRFLIGTSSGRVRLERFEREVVSPRRHLLLAQHLANIFWKRWLREYLPTLLPRKKWPSPSPHLRVGDFVLIVDYQLPRNQWRKGRVSQVTPDR